jgi:hypothetical protein
MEPEEIQEEQDIFDHSRVQELESEDFALASVDGLVLNKDGCSIVLFYDRGPTSMDLREVFVELSEQFSGINFCAVNTTRRSAIMKRIAQIQGNPNHPFWRYLRHIYRESLTPFIMVFREVETGLQYPQAVYNGSTDPESMAEWIGNLACQPGYNEFPGPDDQDVAIDDDTGEGIDYLVNPPRPERLPRSRTVSERELAKRGKIVDQRTLEEEPYDSPSVIPQIPLKEYKSRTKKGSVGYYAF